MKILVLGHSDSHGSALPDEEKHLVWPAILQRELPGQIGQEVEVVNTIFAPLRASSFEIAEALVAEHRPDVVTLGVNPYAFTIESVDNKIRKKWGSDAERRYKTVERWFHTKTRRRRVLGHVNRFAHTVVRKAVGTATVASYDEVVEKYTLILRQLARKEELQVVIMGGIRLAETRQTAPILKLIGQFKDTMTELADEHHFIWFDTEATVAGVNREAYFRTDGIHRNVEGHRRLADMVMPVIAGIAEEDAVASGRH